MFQKIWTSPVWSKVISAGIIALIGFISVVIYYSTTDMSPTKAIIYIWNYKITLGYAFITLISIFLIQILLQNIFSKKERKLTKAEKKSKEFCDQWYKINDDENNVAYRFRTYISSYTKQPFISDLTAFCTKHNGQELKMKWFGGCLDANCANHNISSKERDVKDLIESQIIVEWEKLNGRY